jgi:hypothetical protein
MAKAVFNKNRALFTSTFDLNLTSKMVYLEQGFIWC